MRVSRTKLFTLAFIMLFSVGLAYQFSPSTRMADSREAFSLNEIIPGAFNDWQTDYSITPISVDAQTEAKLAALYYQTLSRAYRNSQGQRIMLSVVYGGDQSKDEMQVHRPEFCYVAQGFQITQESISAIKSGDINVNVRRLLAIQRNRIEPITYWIVIGDEATLPGFGRKLSQLQFGLNGIIPDGLLIRVSSIDNDVERAYQLQAEFIDELISSVGLTGKQLLVGSTKKPKDSPDVSRDS